jgi:hypothetical protein
MDKIERILGEMQAEKANLPSLTGMLAPTDINNIRQQLKDVSDSRVGIWGFFEWLVAVFIAKFEDLLEVFKFDVIAIINAKNNYGHPSWYRDQALRYQHGYTLIFNGDKYEYPVIDETAKVVKLCAVQVVGRRNVIKVASIQGDDTAPIQPAEFIGLQYYFSRISPGGAQVIVKNEVPDELELELVVYYDPLVLDANGKLILNSAIEPARAAALDFVKDFSKFQFNGEFSLTKFQDQLQKVEGVVDPRVNAARAKYGFNAFAPIIDHYLPDAGHLKITNLQITYIAK